MAETSKAKPPVRVVAHDTDWKAICSAELEAIRPAIARAGARAFIDHVGSTAVSGLDAKPVIDVLVTLTDWNGKDAVAAELEALGYRQEGTDDALPRRFFSRPSPGGSIEAFHLHLTPLGSAYGRDMIVFRDSLIGDAEIAQRYVALKRKLAAENPEDFDAYTAGKNDFVALVLRQAAGAFGNDRLLTYQRAELDQAQRYQNFALASQFGVAVIAATSVFFSDNGVQLNLAILGFILAFGWFALTRDLQKASATILQAAIVISGILMTLVLWLGVPLLPSNVTISIARVLIAILVFMLTSDVIGAIVKHGEAANAIGEILQRIETAAARGYPAADILLIMSDYNATVESAPLALPGVYKLRYPSLTMRWRAYLENKQY